MNPILSTLRNIRSEACISVMLNTHRTKPDNQKDPILLKNLVKEAEGRLLNDENKRDARKLIDRLRELEASINHNFNLESLALFVNEDISQYIRLPIAVEDRVIIDNTFATRDLIRAMHMETNYYILVLSQQKVRLIEALNDKLITEVEELFPIENDQFRSADAMVLSDSKRRDNLVSGFFNQVDKALNEVRKDNPLPVLLCTEESNYHTYLKTADKADTIFSVLLNRNRLHDTAHQIVTDAWNVLEGTVKERNSARKSELTQAVGNGLFLSDTNDIWKAIHEGRIRTIFVEKGLFLPGIIENGNISLVDADERDKKIVTDDVLDEMIEANMDYGGEVVFLPNGTLQEFEGFGAVTRY